MQHAALNGYCETDMKSSVQLTSTFPCAMAPTQNTTDSLSSFKSFATNSRIRFTSGALKLNPTLRAPAAKYFVTGCLTTFNSLSGPFDARTESFCNNCTNKPQNRLNVRGILVCGLIFISTFFCVFTYTARTFPALFRGESSIARSAWWHISGR